MAGRCLLAAFLLTALPSWAQFPNETERLAAAGRLWVTVGYFHPSAAAGGIDWDHAFVAAVPAIRAAGNSNEFRAALTELLAPLHDPDTCVLPQTQASADDGTAVPVAVLRTSAGPSFVIEKAGAGQRAVFEVAGVPVAVRLTGRIPADSHTSAAPQDDPYPSTELRLLAAFKTWGVIHYFFAYKDLVDEDFDQVFATSLTKFTDAKDAVAYNLALADLLTHLTDTNTTARSKTLDTYFGGSPVGIRFRMLDKYPIVTRVLDPAAEQAGVRPGDVLKRVGGESTTDRFRRFVQYIPASTPQRSSFDTIERVTRGEAGSEVELSIENAQGEAHRVKLTRKEFSATERAAEPVRVLAGNIGYLDLDQIAPDAAEAAFARLKDTKALILDLRGKAPAAAAIAAHLSTDRGNAVALVTTPIALHPDVATPGIATQTASTFVVKTLAATAAPLYKGRTIALIDERTIGDAEYAGLLFEAAGKTEFVGAPSAGAASAIAEVSLPGGVTLTYSTEDIRHSNGGKLQRLGLQPNVSAPTTAKGLRAGKDEALDAALAYLAR